MNSRPVPSLALVTWVGWTKPVSCWDHVMVMVAADAELAGMITAGASTTNTMQARARRLSRPVGMNGLPGDSSADAVSPDASPNSQPDVGFALVGSRNLPAPESPRPDSGR